MDTLKKKEETRISLKNAPEVICGAILFVDISDYMKAVLHMDPTDEWSFVETAYNIVQQTCANYGYQLARTFGDGFLLFTESAPDEELLTTSGRMLNELNSALGEQGFSFKASLVGGSFLKIVRTNLGGISEIALCGSVVNYAAKKLSATASNFVFISWPINEKSKGESTFNNIQNDKSGRYCNNIEIKNIDSLKSVDLARRATERKAEEQDCEKTDYFAFSTTVKTFVLEVTKLADDKAKTTFAITTALLVYLFNGQQWPTASQVSTATSLHQWISIGLLSLAVCALITSAIFALSVLVPRTWTNFRGYLFFGSIASWPTADDYANEVMKLNTDEIQRASLLHNFEISKVTEAKFKHLRRCLLWMSVGVLFTILFLIANWAAPFLTGP